MTPGARGDRTVHRNLFSTGNRIVGAVGKGGLLLYFDAPSPAGGPQKSIDEGHQEGVTHRAVHARVPVLSSQACAPPSRRPTPLCSCGATLPSARPLDGDIGASTTGRSFPQKKRNARLPPFSTKKKQTTEIATQGRTRDGGGGGGQGCSCCRPCAQKKAPQTGAALWRVRSCGEPTSRRRASTRALDQHSSWCATARAPAEARHMVQEVPCHFGKGITRQEAALRTQVVGLWRVRFPPCLVRPGGRLPVQ